MIDHRRLQRALFVLQMHELTAEAFFAGDERAAGRLQLGPEELELLRAADPAGITADPGGRRRQQVIGNIASEFPLTVARAERLGAAPGFLTARNLHEPFDAVLANGRLPLFFADHFVRAARESEDLALIALAELEAALVQARRAPAEVARAEPGRIARSPRAWLLELPAGTHEHAVRLRAWIDADGGDPPAPPPVGPLTETLLLLRGAAPSPHRVAEVDVERLEPDVALLLTLADELPDAARRANFARERGAEPEDLEQFVDELVQEGVLVRGAAAHER